MIRLFFYLFFVSFHLSLYAQRNEEVKIIERSFNNGIDWTCNVLNINNAFGGNLKSISSSNSKDKRIISNSYVEIVIVAKNGLVNSVAITPKNSIVYNKIIRQLGSWNKNGSTYYIYGYKCSVISSSKEPYFLFFKEESSSSSVIQEESRNKTLEIIENILINQVNIRSAGENIKSLSYFGYPVLNEDLCSVDMVDGINMMYFAYKSSYVLILAGVLNRIVSDHCVIISIAFYDDRLYDNFMREIHKDYKYNNGQYERNSVKCKLRKFKGKNLLEFSIL